VLRRLAREVAASRPAAGVHHPPRVALRPFEGRVGVVPFAVGRVARVLVDVRERQVALLGERLRPQFVHQPRLPELVCFHLDERLSPLGTFSGHCVLASVFVCRGEGLRGERGNQVNFCGGRDLTGDAPAAYALWRERSSSNSIRRDRAGMPTPLIRPRPGPATPSPSRWRASGCFRQPPARRSWNVKNAGALRRSTGAPASRFP
jgi:hypothetical protein